MSFRLLNVFTGRLTEHALTSHPSFLAASHAWSEQLFPPDVDFLFSPGRMAILTTVQQRYPSIKHCWVDTICIDQKDVDDKIRQIPLMGEIFGKAEGVLIILSCELGMRQDHVDSLTSQLDGAIAMEAEEAWATEGQHWQFGDGRSLIAQAMKGLARLTTTAWSTRVWTLQEYILARTITWIGTNLVPLVIDDILFSSLPVICDTLIIEECMGGEFDKLYKFFSGMANVRLRRGDRTRVMELLGNRKATVECDEVYGVMAASGVEVSVMKNEKKEQVWARWVEEALRQGHLRWLLLPTIGPASAIHENCIVVPFSVRHEASSCSVLDKLYPLGPCSVSNGAATVTGRFLGFCHIEKRLGAVHEPEPNHIHRDITVILYAAGRWSYALRVGSALSAGRYKTRHIVSIAQALIDNWSGALRAVHRGSEERFKMKFRTEGQARIWKDFMLFMASRLTGLNAGVAYLATIRRASMRVDTIIVVARDQHLPAGELAVVDVGGRTPDGLCVFLIATKSTTSGAEALSNARHKVAVTLPLSSAFEGLVKHFKLESFTFGGRNCQVCHEYRKTALSDGIASTMSPVRSLGNRRTERVQCSRKRRRSKYLRRRLR
ncbi:heterokaryon incompatibility [Truncatella angustata]|uniref:Heterokaryon incompatibility n=1 Tax=Truncatella angustata TaxID=152316 RepID=A0A9P8RKP5_9PEZI|nr:heterokaryon incompatibility [Truncatella angustata]KAH6647830.1 heterokaryon incompatibility [Truncatella angustata]